MAQHTQVTIPTPDGSCPAHVFTPAGAGPFPAVLMFMDGVGIRPSLLAHAARLADHGFYVLLPDLFYRAAPYGTLSFAMFSEPEGRQRFFKVLLPSTGNSRVAVDGQAFLAFMDQDPRANTARLGTTGYCMGGGMSLTMAALFPARVAAACSFHGGNLASDAVDSPHLLAPRIKARVHVGGARDDSSFPAEQAARLQDAFTSAGVDFVLEHHNARHGWTMTDSPVFDAVEAEKHWVKMLALFDATLKG